MPAAVGSAQPRAEAGPCRLCGSDESSPLIPIRPPYEGLSVTHYESFVCAECGLTSVFPDPPEADLAHLYSGEDYLQEVFSQSAFFDWVVEHHWTPVLDAIEKHAEGRRGSILDVSCINGRFMRLARERGWDAYGTDVNEQMLALARADHGEDHVRRCDAHDLAWDGRQFDAVRFSHVLEHLTEPRQALDRLAAIVRPGGLLNVGLPLFDERVRKLAQRVPAPELRRKLIRLLGHLDPPHHLTAWTSETLEQALNQAGFDVLWRVNRSDMHPFLPGFRVPFIIFRTIGVPLSLLGSGAITEVIARRRE